MYIFKMMSFLWRITLIFNELDKKMRVFETSHDLRVLPEVYIVVRVDGRSFTRLTKETRQFDTPFDTCFRDYMVETVKHLMVCGFKVVYGYTQSDEISLLLHKDDDLFGRKARKVISIFAGEASSKFTLLLGDLACFDARVSELPTKALVVDYFRWRSEDASRNALNSHCYWLLRKNGKSAKEATDYLSGISVADKNELLFQNGVNFNNVPNWQKRGIGVYWEVYEKPGVNPMTDAKAVSTRKKLVVDYDLPIREEYSEFISALLTI